GACDLAANAGDQQGDAFGVVADHVAAHFGAVLENDDDLPCCCGRSGRHDQQSGADESKEDGPWLSHGDPPGIVGREQVGSRRPTAVSIRSTRRLASACRGLNVLRLPELHDSAGSVVACRMAGDGPDVSHEPWHRGETPALATWQNVAY